MTPPAKPTTLTGAASLAIRDGPFQERPALLAPQMPIMMLIAKPFQEESANNATPGIQSTPQLKNVESPGLSHLPHLDTLTLSAVIS